MSKSVKWLDSKCPRCGYSLQRITTQEENSPTTIKVQSRIECSNYDCDYHQWEIQ